MNILINILTSIACDYGDLQLVGGVVPYEGTVEICDQSGLWVTICDELWSDSDATVVCRQLGYLEDGEWVRGSGILRLRVLTCTRVTNSVRD